MKARLQAPQNPPVVEVKEDKAKLNENLPLILKGHDIVRDKLKDAGCDYIFIPKVTLPNGGSLIGYIKNLSFTANAAYIYVDKHNDPECSSSAPLFYRDKLQYLVIKLESTLNTLHFKQKLNTPYRKPSEPYRLSDDELRFIKDMSWHSGHHYHPELLEQLSNYYVLLALGKGQLTIDDAIILYHRGILKKLGTVEGYTILDKGYITVAEMKNAPPLIEPFPIWYQEGSSHHKAVYYCIYETTILTLLGKEGLYAFEHGLQTLCSVWDLVKKTSDDTHTLRDLFKDHCGNKVFEDKLLTADEIIIANQHRIHYYFLTEKSIPFLAFLKNEKSQDKPLATLEQLTSIKPNYKVEIVKNPYFIEFLKQHVMVVGDLNKLNYDCFSEIFTEWGLCALQKYMTIDQLAQIPSNWVRVLLTPRGLDVLEKGEITIDMIIQISNVSKDPYRYLFDHELSKACYQAEAKIITEIKPELDKVTTALPRYIEQLTQAKSETKDEAALNAIEKLSNRLATIETFLKGPKRTSVKMKPIKEDFERAFNSARVALSKLSKSNQRLFKPSISLKDIICRYDQDTTLRLSVLNIIKATDDLARVRSEFSKEQASKKYGL